MRNKTLDRVINMQKILFKPCKVLIRKKLNVLIQVVGTSGTHLLLHHFELKVQFLLSKVEPSLTVNVKYSWINIRPLLLQQVGHRFNGIGFCRQCFTMNLVEKVFSLVDEDEERV